MHMRWNNPQSTSFELIKFSHIIMTVNPSVLTVNHCTVLNIIVCLLQIIAFSHSSGCPADTLPCRPSAVSVERSGPENAA